MTPGRGEAPSIYRGAGGSRKTSENLIAALLDSASQSILGVEGAGEIILANARTQEMFGYSREELLGSPIEILLPDSLREKHAAQREAYFAEPRVRPMGAGLELSAQRKDGSRFPVEVSLSYVTVAGGVFAIAFVTDISPRKRLEEQFLHAQKMEAVGRLAGGVAHDFNNLLTVMAGYTQMILDRLSAGDSLRLYAEEIQKAADRATTLTNRLLSFSRKQVGRPVVLDVNAALMQNENLLRRLIGEDVILSLELSPEAGKITADPGQLEQIVFNLATNARDAMPQGGQLTIGTSAMALDDNYSKSHLGVRPGDYVMLEVSDTGHGMDAETQRRIFEPFFTTKELEKGTGLGLSTVYGIVKQAGGDIWVYSEVGRGTVFKVYFPRVSDLGSAPTEAPVAHVTSSAATILLVEDDPAVRGLSLRMLEQLGYHAIATAGGAEALQVAASNSARIDLLLTDVVMPHMSGVELAKQIRIGHPKIRVLYVSGYAEQDGGGTRNWRARRGLPGEAVLAGSPPPKTV